MVSKIKKIIFVFLIFSYQNVSYSKNFDEKNIYNYFSALVLLDKNKPVESLNYFNSSKQLKESHPSYIKKYLFSLVLAKKVSKAISEIKTTKEKNFVDFFEAHLLLVLDSLKTNDYKKSLYYIKNLKKHEEEGTFEFIIFFCPIGPTSFKIICLEYLCINFLLRIFFIYQLIQNHQILLWIQATDLLLQAPFLGLALIPFALPYHCYLQ